MHSGIRTRFRLLEQPTASCARAYHQAFETMPHRTAVRRLCFAVLLLLLLAPARSFVFFGAPASPRRYGTLKRSGDVAENGESSLPVLWTIPIFPLRKTIKLPGESLTLNLYEERYLALATWISDNQADTQQAFGALYTSNKPQIVSDQGRGAIVPLLRPGDIGVLFPVQQWKEGMVPTRNVERRRRIRIVGTGVARFRIEKLVHNGYGGGENVRPEEALPFILAQVRLYRDDTAESDDDEPSSLAMATSRYNQPILSDDEIKLLSDRAKAMGIPDAVMREEFQSFLMASTTLPHSVGDHRKDILKSRSTRDRLRIMLQN